jgi:hypothetical protein
MPIATKFTGYTAISGVVATLLGGAALELPDGARQIVGIVPYVTSPAGNTAAEPVAVELYVESDDLKVTPYHILPSPIGSSLLKSVAQVQGKSQFYGMYCPVKGGESLRIYAKGLFDHTIEPYCGALVIYSDEAPAKPQRYSKISTYTNTGTGAARVSGGTISIVGGKRLVEVGGFAVGTTVAALKGLAGHLDFNSEGFTPSWDLHLPIEPASGQVDTNIQECIAGVARREVNIAMADKSTINVGFTLAVALTTTGNFVAQVTYN